MSPLTLLAGPGGIVAASCNSSEFLAISIIISCQQHEYSYITVVDGVKRMNEPWEKVYYTRTPPCICLLLYYDCRLGSS